jgi:acid phosphatase family membrane protein YuiD
MISGFDSVPFAVALVLAFFMIYDAKVIRGAAGKQAQSLNILIEMYNEEEGGYG